MSNSSIYIYEDTFQKIKYNFEVLCKENEILFNIKGENINNKEYETSFPLYTLVDKNNIFKVFNNLEDCYNYIIKLINNKKYRIEKEDNDICLIFYIKNMITEKEEEIKLNIKTKIFEINDILDSHNKIIKEIK